MGEDLTECCVCGDYTSDYRRVDRCEGCGASYCCTDCVENGALSVCDDNDDNDDSDNMTFCLQCVCVNQRINKFVTL